MAVELVCILVELQTSTHRFAAYVISTTHCEDFNSRLELTDFISFKFSIIKQLFFHTFLYFLSSFYLFSFSLIFFLVSSHTHTHTHTHLHTHRFSQMFLTNISSFVQLSPCRIRAHTVWGVMGGSTYRPSGMVSAHTHTHTYVDHSSSLLYSNISSCLVSLCRSRLHVVWRWPWW